MSTCDMSLFEQRVYREKGEGLWKLQTCCPSDVEPAGVSTVAALEAVCATLASLAWIAASWEADSGLFDSPAGRDLPLLSMPAMVEYSPRPGDACIGSPASALLNQ